MKPSVVETEGPLPIVEERLEVHTENVAVARVHVRKRALTRTVEVPPIPLARERVTVERVPINQYVECAPEPRVEGDATVIPVVEEVLVRALVLREELWVRKTCETTTTETQSVELVSEEAVVEREELDPAACIGRDRAREGEASG